MNERLKKVIAKALELPEEKITEFSDDKNTDNWDSIHTLQMIVFVEREFKITIPDNRIGNMVSYKMVEEIVNDCTRRN